MRTIRGYCRSLAVSGFALALLASPILSAQTIERRANITGGGGDSGRCTIQAEVDNVAEITVVGDRGLIRTLAGQPSTLQRIDCTGPLPTNMNDVRVQAREGRGFVQMVRDPRSNHGQAVI